MKSLAYLTTFICSQRTDRHVNTDGAVASRSSQVM